MTDAYVYMIDGLPYKHRHYTCWTTYADAKTYAEIATLSVQRQANWIENETQTYAVLLDPLSPVAAVRRVKVQSLR